MNKNNLLLSVLGLLVSPTIANAGLPLLNATCPTGIEVHSDQGGPVYINGKEVKLKVFNDNYYEAKGSGVVVSISINPDGSPSVSYTGKHRANGICQISSNDIVEPAASAPDNTKVAVEDMARYCAGEASAKFNQRPTNISTQPALEDQGMYTVWGQFPPSGADPTVFTCTFSGDGKLVGVDKQ